MYLNTQKYIRISATDLCIRRKIKCKNVTNINYDHTQKTMTKIYKNQK